MRKINLMAGMAIVVMAVISTCATFVEAKEPTSSILSGTVVNENGIIVETIEYWDIADPYHACILEVMTTDPTGVIIKGACYYEVWNGQNYETFPAFDSGWYINNTGPMAGFDGDKYQSHQVWLQNDQTKEIVVPRSKGGLTPENYIPEESWPVWLSEQASAGRTDEKEEYEYYELNGNSYSSKFWRWKYIYDSNGKEFLALENIDNGRIVFPDDYVANPTPTPVPTTAPTSIIVEEEKAASNYELQSVQESDVENDKTDNLVEMGKEDDSVTVDSETEPNSNKTVTHVLIGVVIALAVIIVILLLLGKNKGKVLKHEGEDEKTIDTVTPALSPSTGETAEQSPSDPTEDSIKAVDEQKAPQPEQPKTNNFDYF